MSAFASASPLVRGTDSWASRCNRSTEPARRQQSISGPVSQFSAPGVGIGDIVVVQAVGTSEPPYFDCTARTWALSLMIALANRDGAHFLNPDRLGFSRYAGGQLFSRLKVALLRRGPLTRMAATIAISAFLQYFGATQAASQIGWRGGARFRSLAQLFISNH
jgi:hypothetical protein